MTPSAFGRTSGPEKTFSPSSSAFFSCLRRRRCLYFLAVLPLTWPQQAVLRSADPADSAGRGAQFRFVPDHAHADDDVDVLHLPLWLLARHAAVQFFQDPANHWGALDAFFIMLPVPRRDLRIRHSLSGILPDHLAAAARAGVAA